MPDDQVRIDPEFQPPPPGDGQGRWLRLAGVVAVVVAAFIFGWLLGSPSPAESEPDEVAVTSSTELTGETVAASTTTRPRATTTTTTPEVVELQVPLGGAVPGFTDTITMTHWDEERIDVLQWQASWSAPVTIASFDQGEDTAWFAGLDASGRWAAQVTNSGLLTVHPVPERIDERWPEEFDEAVDVRVASAVWHDHDPGRLAWVKCSRSVEVTDPSDSDAWPLGVATLYSFDMTATDPGVPVAEFTIDGGCVAGWGISPHLNSWGDEGVSYWSEADPEGEHLIRPDGIKVDLPPDAYPVVAPDGSAVVIDHDRLGESYLLSSDGTTRSPVPGLAADEWLDGVLWSPDGALLAYWSRWGEEGDPVIRIVEMDTDSVVAEVMTPDWESWPVTWSTDSRFLLLEQIPSHGSVETKDLVFYDTATDSTVEIPMALEMEVTHLTDPPPSAELAAHYPLDSDATDLSVYSHHGETRGVDPTTDLGPIPVEDRFGTPGGALSFDGQHDRVVIEMAPQLMTESVSVAAWVKLDEEATARDVGAWWDVVSYGSEGHVLAIQGEGAVLGGLQLTAAECEFMGSETVLDGGWHHVAITRDLVGTIRVYLDGAAQPVTPHTIDPDEVDPVTAATCAVHPEFHDQIWIGADPEGWEYFHGSIDDVRIYSGVLTDDEVATLALDRP